MKPKQTEKDATRIRCVHCKTITSVPRSIDQYRCPSCCELLQKHPHFSKRLNAYFGISAESETKSVQQDENDNRPELLSPHTAIDQSIKSPLDTYRADFTFSNSQKAIDRFPFPFKKDSYAYTINLESHAAGLSGSPFEHALDIDEHYISEMNERDLVLRSDPLRCQALPHMKDAEWEFLEFVMTTLVRDYPQSFSLTKDGQTWQWINRPLNISQTFEVGDDSTLPMSPLEYAGRHCQSDFILCHQRDGNLWLDAGIATSLANWSLDFDLGMNFLEWHAPVPLANEARVFERALKFLLNLKTENPMRRLNWSLTVNPRLDTSAETYNEWGKDCSTVTSDNIGEKLHLRVELQGLWRLPRTNTILFSIRTYLLSFEDLTTRPDWAQRTYRVMQSLPEVMIDYKGLTRFHAPALAYLKPFNVEQAIPESVGRSQN